MHGSAPLDEFVTLLEPLRHPRDCVVALGLGQHPQSRMKCNSAGDRRNPVHEAVIYRADPFSKYALPPPQVKALEVETVPYAGHMFNVSSQ